MSRPRILIVEDEAIVALNMKRFLEGLGYEVAGELRNGEEAVERVQDLDPDLILMDIALSGDMDGIAAAREIRKRKDVPVIYMTGNADRDTISKARDTAPYGFLTKPADDREFFAGIENALYRHGLEKRLRVSEEKLAGIIRFTPNAITIAELETGIIVEANEGIRWTGWSPEEVIGKTAEELNAWIHTGDRSTLLDMLSESGAVKNYPVSFRRRDGSIAHGLASISIITVEQKKFILTITSDVTGLRQAEERARLACDDLNAINEELVGTNLRLMENEEKYRRASDAVRDSEQRFRTIMEEIPVIVTILDGDGHYRYSSPSIERILDLKLEEFTGELNYRFFHPDDVSAIRNTLAALMAVKGSMQGIQYRHIKGDGGYSWVESVGRNLLDDPVINGIVIVTRDVSDEKRVAEALMRSEEHYRMLFDNTGTALMFLDEDTTILLVNKEFENTFGYSKEELEGRMTWPGFVADDGMRERMLEYNRMRRVAPDLVPRSYESRLRVRSGEVRDFFLQVTMIPGTRQSLVSLTDISERKKAEEALRESEEQYRSLVNNMQDTLYRTDSGGNIVLVSPSGAQLLGCDSVEEMIGMNVAMDFYYYPELRSELLGILKEKGSVTNYEVVLKKRDGTPVIVSTNSHLYFDKAGKLLGVEGIFVDITGRRKAEKALRESEEKYRILFENMSNGFVLFELVFDDAGGPCDARHVELNQAYAQILDIREKKVTGKTLRDVVPFMQEDWIGVFREVSGSGSPAHGERYVETLKKHLEYSVFSPEKNYIAVIINDVTGRKIAEEERKQLEIEMQHVQKLESLGVLAGGIAHDLNNILMAVLGNADMAAGALAPGSHSLEYVSEIEKAARRGADLCRQMLAYSGRGTFVLEAVNLSHLARDMGRMLEVSIPKKITVQYNYMDELPPILGDVTQLRQVVMNLITNASEAIGDRQGMIAVTTGVMHCDREFLSQSYIDEKLPEGEYVYIEVSDDGSGMDDVTHTRLFDPFFTTKFTGRGLGLASVLGIVRGHRGAIMVVSAPGLGTTMTVLFPAGSVTEGEKAPPGQEVKPWSARGTALVVDDEESVRRIGVKMLEHLGYTVRSAANGREAVDIFKSIHDELACVVLDLTMPVMNGQEAFREMHGIDPRVPVIICSGYNEQELAWQVREKGIAGFLQKPYMLSDLKMKLHEVFSKRS